MKLFFQKIITGADMLVVSDDTRNRKCKRLLIKNSRKIYLQFVHHEGLYLIKVYSCDKM